MSQKSSLPQAASFVSQVLKRDTHERSEPPRDCFHAEALYVEILEAVLSRLQAYVEGEGAGAGKCRQR